MIGNIVSYYNVKLIKLRITHFWSSNPLVTALGVDFTDSNLNSQYVEATEVILNTMVERFMKFWWHSPYTFAWSNVKKKQDACLKILHNMSNVVRSTITTYVKKRKKTHLFHTLN